MADGPVRVVRQRVDGLDGHHRAFEGGHAVEGQGHDQEAQDGVFTQTVPCARQGHDAVDHAAPRRCEQDEREGHAQRLGPVGQGGVVQVVRTCPHVGEDQRPEVDDGQAVRVDGAADLLGHEVVHHAQEAGGQEEAHRIVAIPPLHHGVLHTAIDRVGLHEAGRNGDVVDDVQQRHGQDEAAVEPVGHVDVLDLALDDGAEEDDGEGHPDGSDQQVNGPFQLGVLLGLGVAQGQGDDGADDDGLPAPEGERGQLGREQRHL